MTKLSKVIIFIFAIGVLTISCVLTDWASEVFSRFPTPTPGLGDPVLAPLDLYVSTTGNDTNDCLSETMACKTLYAAFNKSRPNTIIHIGPGEFIEERVIYTRYALTLIGSGPDQTMIGSVTTDAIGYDYVLKVGTGGPVVIRELGIIGRGAEDVDAGIEVIEGGNVSLENCRVADTKVGVLIRLGGSATINNCIITKNASGIQNDGNLEMSDTQLRDGSGGALSNTGIANITDITFFNNGSVDEAAPPLIINNSGQLNISTSFISSNNGTAVFNVGDLVLDHVGIYHNNNVGDRPSGIQTLRGDLTIRSSVIENNSSYGITVSGGNVGIYETALVNNAAGGLWIENGSVIVQNATITRNGSMVPYGGSGIDLVSGGNLELINSTVVLNESPGVTAAPSAYFYTRNSVIAANFGVQCRGFPVGIFSADGNFNVGCDESWTMWSLGLGLLTDEAGTLVYPLLPGSPLIDAGPLARYLCPAIDQRGFVRPVGVKCDIGAYESGSAIEALEFVTPSGGVPGVVPLYTATPVPTSIPQVTETPQAPTPTPITGLSFNQPGVSLDHFYYGQGNCLPTSLNLKISVSDPSQVSDMLLFVHLQDKAGGGKTPWSEGVVMTPLGAGNYEYNLASTSIPDYASYQEAWLLYQFVASGPGGTLVLRSDVFSNATLFACQK